MKVTIFFLFFNIYEMRRIMKKLKFIVKIIFMFLNFFLTQNLQFLSNDCV